MNFQQSICIAISLLLLSSSASARLGESLDDLKKMWGDTVAVVKSEIVEKEQEHVFSHNNWLIYVILFEGEAVCFKYDYREERENGKPVQITEADIQPILRLSTEGRAWKHEADGDGVKYYMPFDRHDYVGIFRKKDNMLIVMDTTKMSKLIESSRLNTEPKE